jgi:DNA-binding MarR family transcriptional regulator
MNTPAQWNIPYPPLHVQILGHMDGMTLDDLWKHAAKNYDKRIEVLASINARTRDEFDAVLLDFIADNPVSRREIARFMNVNHSNVSVRIKRLTAQGFVIEGSDGKRGKSKPINITPSGREFLARMKA